MFTKLLCLFVATLGTGACDRVVGSDDEKPKEASAAEPHDETKPEGEPKAPERDAAPAEAVKEAVAAAQEELSDAAKYDADLRKKGCELLTPKLVAETLAVSESELKQHALMGCAYTWKSDDEILEARLTSIRAHKSERSAAAWFANATKGMTKEEAAEATAKIHERLAEEGKLPSKTHEEAAKGLTEGMLDMVGAEGFTFEDVEGVGDEARVGLSDGEIWVRVDNLTFTLAAYKGKKAPKPEPVPDLAKLTARAKELNRTWLEETHAQRRQQATQLAKALVATL